jgi:hypothetical protein
MRRAPCAFNGVAGWGRYGRWGRWRRSALQCRLYEGEDALAKGKPEAGDVVVSRVVGVGVRGGIKVVWFVFHDGKIRTQHKTKNAAARAAKRLAKANSTSYYIVRSKSDPDYDKGD